jgi:dipeptidyl-peptidase-4
VVGDAPNLLAWTREQPAMLIHELAHAYYDRVLKRDAPDVVAAFEKAKAGGTYDRVLHVGGRRERAYAMNNVDEYFAEGTEAYFATNDFYPFVRAELIEHDPDLARALERVWAAKSR